MITTNLQELRATIINKINERGLKECWAAPAWANSNDTHYNLTGKQEIINNYISGLELELTETNKRNAAVENISYYIIIREYKYSCGTKIESVKVSSKDSVNKQTRLINEIIDKYLEKVSA